MKRKHDADLANYAKKPRLDSGLTTIFEKFPTMETPVDIHVSAPPLEIDMPDEVPTLSSACPTNERAIVLYKPENPELFISKPIPRAPIIQLDRRIFTAELLSASNTLRQLGVLTSTSAGPGLVTGAATSEDILDNRLAVIPWVSNSTSIPATSLGFPPANQMEASQALSEAISSDDEMRVDSVLESEAMEEDSGLNVNEHTQPNNPIINFGTEPWQHYGVPYPQFGSVMWSH